KYDAAVVSAARADAFAERLEHILRAFTDAPHQQVSHLDVRTDAERTRPTTSVSRPGPAITLADAFAAAVRRAPRSVALRCGDQQLTYAELDNRATSVAAELISRGVHPESRVAVALPRSIDLIVGLLGVLKAGGTYVPVDIDSPATRLRHILADSGPVCVLVDRADRLADSIPGATPALVLSDLVSSAPSSSASPAVGLSPDHGAYVIYTSGSTGVPKGVTVTHRNVGALFHAAKDVSFDLGPDDVWTMFHSAAFDFSVWELWGALWHGGCLVIVEPAVARDPDRFLDLLAREQVTVLNQTPSAFYPLIDADDRLHPALALRYVVFGGEALDTSRLTRWYEKHSPHAPELVNMYGITETCVHVSHRPLTATDPGRGDSVIGDALPGLQIHLLDGNMAPVPIGVTGEMYIAGGQLARGYLNRPGLTAGRFVANPFDGAGERLYRSGDTAMWTDTGELVYLGRSDHQVKVRGYRIELGEVESALAAAPGVTNAAAAVHHDESGRARLIGYLTGAADPGVVRADLEQRLPAYMVPSALVAMSALPLTVNGKLDRAALPRPKESPAPAPIAAAPQGPAARLAALCTEILHTDVGVDDDFFAAGGDSIVAIQLVNRARRLGIRITPQEVFTHRTPSALAAVVLVETSAAEPNPPQVPHQDSPQDSPQDNGEVMLTPIVQRLAELGGTVTRFNQSELLLTPPGTSRTTLEAALHAVLAHHDALRLRLHRPSPLLWSLETTADAQLVLDHVDAVGQDLDELLGIHSEAAVARLDPDTATVVQAVWFDRGPAERGRLLLTVHHLAIDGVSWRILIDDLIEAYTQIATGGQPTPAPVPTSVRAYARTVNENAQQAARLAEFDHWATTLAPGGELNPDTAPVGLTVGATREHRVALTVAETVPLLTTVPAAAHADVTDTLVAAFMVAVQRYRAQRGAAAAALVLDLERHGRDGWPELDLSRTVGWFTAIAPVRLPADRDGELLDALKRVKETLRAVPDGGLGFGQLRYCNPRTAAALARLSAPQVLFNYLGRVAGQTARAWAPAPEADALRTDPDPDLGTPYLLEVNAFSEDTTDGPRLHATFTYADGERAGDDAAALAGIWVEVLREFGALTANSSASL
ncbi:MAG: Peptide synthetase, partial [Mycobacterium sp.]|nr:Peptide synthetase [Mycobacterium sp.]